MESVHAEQGDKNRLDWSVGIKVGTLVGIVFQAKGSTRQNQIDY